MINNFKKKFGNEKEVIVCVRDYEQMKHKELKR